MPKLIKLYTLNIQFVVCQSYLNKATSNNNNVISFYIILYIIKITVLKQRNYKICILLYEQTGNNVS